MFTKILIANRGEIACRIIKTAKRLGITCVAVYSDIDKNAMHVQLADAAYCIGPAPAAQSYLCGAKIIEAALATGTQAIHPGYGFLSENAEFAEQCQKAGLVFIGPPPAAIRAMGLKSAAKQRMQKAKVPLIPGYHNDAQDLTALQNAAERIGYPLLIKAVAGGGGKGMRIVYHAGELPAAVAAAQREALASFANDKLILEKYFINPRHVEMQIFADSQGNTIYLFERDCSIQRRHQKIIEEAPAPDFSAAMRKAMGEAAVTAAKAIGYVGAGTIEFLLADGQFYFMEMNTRLQVEHPVTEMITGLDLVEWQLKIAAGEALPLRQEQLAIKGHAFEARIYAEDPYKDFLPSTGAIHYLKTPEENRHVRLDTGVRQGDAVTPYYDPMLAKLIVWDIDRNKALHQLTRALAQTQLAGPQTNLNLLASVAQHPAFIAGIIHTGFIAEHQAALMHAPCANDQVLLLAVLFLLLRQEKIAAAHPSNGDEADRYSPWRSAKPFRINLSAKQEIVLEQADTLFKSRIECLNAHYAVTIGERTYSVQGSLANATELSAFIEGRHDAANVFYANGILFILYNGNRYQLRYANDNDNTTINLSQDKKTGLMTPMPGKIIALNVKAGDEVKKEAALAIIEAMKMEHTIHAPYDGIVKECYYKTGDIVNEGVALFSLEEIKG